MLRSSRSDSEIPVQMKLLGHIACLLALFCTNFAPLQAERPPTYYTWNGVSLQPSYDDPSQIKVVGWQVWFYTRDPESETSKGRWGVWTEETVEKLIKEVKRQQKLELALAKWCESCRTSKYTTLNPVYPISGHIT